MESLDIWTIIRAAAFIISGASGIYLLLPHGHGRTKPALAHGVGYGLSAASVVLFATFWRTGGEPISRIFFYGFGLAALIGAVATITSRNPIHSALWFASVVLATAGLFLLAGAQFLAAGTIIVYAGAIIVTFLFVIMLAQMEGQATYDRISRSPFWATFSSFILLFALTCVVLALRVSPSSDPDRKTSAAAGFPSALDRLAHPNQYTVAQNLVFNRALPPTSKLPDLPPPAAKPGAADEPREVVASGRHVAGLGAALYTEHLVTVELAGALLFAALVGALAIATPKAPIRPSTSDAAPNAA